ncbi:hypothetical protein GCM10025868_00010 [Angustibacter aerolatus]|uniref:Alkyl hydroperoxide reductase subunit C/ Thiol specific antioxidant domain-containing protein n=1 Tax=Angustibacter aerolatus TaxID=1162965 RepID=A0ABQ6JB10_9ACTN|nr:hypothetical protein GCM10025868_00010 [Angustibacter aerolatus]
MLLVFFPFAFSGICTTEACAFRDDLSTYQNDDVQVLAISCDPVTALRAWSEAQGYEFPLLSDFWPHGAVSSLVRRVLRRGRHVAARHVPGRP